MKTLLLILLLGFSTFGQTAKPLPKKTPLPKTTKPIIETEAKTKDGKSVILKSDGTWFYNIETPLNQDKENNVSKKITVPFISDSEEEVSVFLDKSDSVFLPDKSQYETEMEYATRLSEIFYESATGVKKPVTEIAFLLGYELEQSYNAEKEILSYKIRDSYRYRAFGKLQLVRAFDNEYRLYEPAFSFEMPIKEARTKSFNLRTAVFGYPVRNPKIREREKDKVWFFLKRIVVFNGQTGEIHYETSEFNKDSYRFSE